MHQRYRPESPGLFPQARQVGVLARHSQPEVPPPSSRASTESEMCSLHWLPGLSRHLQVLRNAVQAEPVKHSVFLRQVTHEAPKRRRQLFDERGRGDDLLLSRDTRMLINIDHLEVITSLKVLLADGFDTREGFCRTRGHSRDVQL